MTQWDYETMWLNNNWILPSVQWKEYGRKKKKNTIREMDLNISSMEWTAPWQNCISFIILTVDTSQSIVSISGIVWIPQMWNMGMKRQRSWKNLFWDGFCRFWSKNVGCKDHSYWRIQITSYGEIMEKIKHWGTKDCNLHRMSCVSRVLHRLKPVILLKLEKEATFLKKRKRLLYIVKVVIIIIWGSVNMILFVGLKCHNNSGMKMVSILVK